MVVYLILSLVTDNTLYFKGFLPSVFCSQCSVMDVPIVVFARVTTLILYHKCYEMSSTFVTSH